MHHCFLSDAELAELAQLKYWDSIWGYYEKQPETIEALQGIFSLLSHADHKNLVFEADFSKPNQSSLNRLFADPMSLKEVTRMVLKMVKGRFTGDTKSHTVTKGLDSGTTDQDSTFDVELKESRISKIGFKRKKISSLCHTDIRQTVKGRVVSWTSRRVNSAQANIYQSLKAAISEGAFTRSPLCVKITERHFRYPVYQHKQSFNMMLVLDISNSVRWILGFMDKIIAMLTSEANAAQDKLGLIVFNNDHAQMIHYPTINIRHVVGTINTLSPKGKTPLAEGMKMALQTLEQSRYQVTGMSNAIVLLSDCFPEPISGEYEDQMEEPACRDFLQVCEKIGNSGIKLLILNPGIEGAKKHEKLLGFRLGRLAAERAGGRFINLLAKVNLNKFTMQSEYHLAEQTLAKYMQEINGFRHDL